MRLCKIAKLRFEVLGVRSLVLGMVSANNNSRMNSKTSRARSKEVQVSPNAADEECEPVGI